MYNRIIHTEGLSFKPFSPPSAADDHEMFSKWSWGQINPDTLLDDSKYHATEQDKKDVAVIEQIAYWYIKSFLASLTAEDREKAASHFTKHIQWCEYVITETEAGRNVWYEPDWDMDTRADFEEMIRQ